jgi:hypothetical protein
MVTCSALAAVVTPAKCLPKFARTCAQPSPIRISQYPGAQARGCRLDPAAPEQAVAIAGSRLDRGARI